MKLALSSKRFGLLILATAGLTAAELSPECGAAYRPAVALLAGEQNEEAAKQLSQFASRLGSSDSDKVCKAFALNSLAIAYERLGNFDGAQDAAKESVSLFEETLGPDTPSLRPPLLLLAQVATAKEQFAKADKLLSRVEQLPGATHSHLAIARGLRASLLVREKEYTEAEAAYRQSIAERELAGRGSSLDIAPELCNLANLYISEHRASEALPLLERTLRIAESAPFDANARAQALLGLALAHSTNKNQEEQAEGYFRKAVDLIDRVPGVVRAQMGRTIYLHYAAFLKGCGRKREAKVVVAEANTLFGPDSSGMLVSVDSLLQQHKQKQP